MGNGKKILIVDDCSTTRKILSSMIKSIGYSPVAAMNGFDALEKLAQNDISLMVTDLNMPQMDGLELIKNIRESDDYKGIPIIMVTTESDERDREQGMEAGADVYVTKPVTSQRLTYEIKKLL